MAAFEAAYHLGFRWMETDAHVTADGVVVAFHDDRLDRVTDRVGIVAELGWAEVSAARIDGLAPIPLLADLIGGWPDVRVNIDPKHDAAVGPLIDVLRRSGALDRVCVGSFSDTRLDRLRAELGPGLCSSTGPVGVQAVKRLADGAVAVAPRGAQCLQVPPAVGDLTLVDEGFVDTAHGLGLHVHVWTIDDPNEMVRLLDLGVDGVMTDRPAVLRDVLISRGEWVEAAPRD
jgi:glycerophosphoryl diester phosphodiesterase